MLYPYNHCDVSSLEGILMGWFKKLFGSKNERYLKTLTPIVQQINDLEPQIKAMSDEELKAQTSKFRARLAEGATLDDLLVEAHRVHSEALAHIAVDVYMSAHEAFLTGKAER